MRTRRFIEKNMDDPNGFHKIIDLSENFLDCFDENSDKLIDALNKNSKSSEFLAKVWIFIWIVWMIATVIWTIYWILSYFK